MFISSVVKKVFGSSNDRLLLKLKKQVEKINALEKDMEALSDLDLKNKTQEFKDRYNNGESLDSILVEAFAVVRESSKRTLKMRHFDVQLIGGMVIHSGKIAEMGTGEGKTLGATLPIYLNAITGKGAHLVTVNDYLATRDANWMRPVYENLGLTVGIVVHGMEKAQKQAAYAADITYGTNNEYGFDYLRDNMAFSKAERVQRKPHFAIVDEVDSILIDEARTPLIISGADRNSTNLYQKVNKIIPLLTLQTEKDGPGDFSLDEKSKQVFFTEDGHEKVEKILAEEKLLAEGDSLYDAANIMLVHHLYAGLRAHNLFKKDIDYIVKNDQIIIVDEFTGRTMEGRRWSDGLHQAVEAKEGVKIQSENQTLASITFQNYFRLYEKLAGMTGTADTEAYEFQQIYGLEVVVMPTNKPKARKDYSDLVYLTQEEKYKAIIEDIQDCFDRKQPVLVGTASIESSELLSNLLKKKKIKHKVLNAKFHEKEASIIAEAGRPGSVTIATNMAGRGTDIVLGGNLKVEIENLTAENQDLSNAEIEKVKENWKSRHASVLEAGGLHIIGTERHESRRIDNQLRGRAGRQGDPGSTRFYLSVKDNLMRIFVSDKISGLLNKLGNKGEAITHPWVTKAIENAQRKVEGHNFDIRKQLLQFDDVNNDQRKVIYTQRDYIIETDNISDMIKDVRQDVLESVVNEFIPVNRIEDEWNIPGLMQLLDHSFGNKLPIDEWLEKEDSLNEESLKHKIINILDQFSIDKEKEIGEINMRQLEKNVMLSVLDHNWKEHLSTMDYMRQSIHLRGYAQKDPKQEYQREAFLLFTEMLESMKREVISLLFMIKVKDEGVQSLDKARLSTQPEQLEFKHQKARDLTQDLENEENRGFFPKPTIVRGGPKVGRNESCPCGSGSKYKQCHGRLL